MNKNNNLVTALLVVLIILIAFLVFRLKETVIVSPNVSDTSSTQTVVKNTENTNNPERRIPGQGDLIVWKVTQRQDNQVFYKEQWKAVPQEGGYSFELLSGNFINWGLNGQPCDPNAQFIYGSSSVACVNGLNAYMGVKNVREALSQQDLNDFGDFVLKNQ